MHVACRRFGFGTACSCAVLHAFGTSGAAISFVVERLRNTPARRCCKMSSPPSSLARYEPIEAFVSYGYGGGDTVPFNIRARASEQYGS